MTNRISESWRPWRLKDSGFETQEFAGRGVLMAAVRSAKARRHCAGLMMPPPDGLAVCHKIRADESTRPIPILMLTARGEEVDRVLGLEMGGDYITKPLQRERALRPVRAVIRRKGPFSGSGRGSDLRADLREYGGPAAA